MFIELGHNGRSIGALHGDPAAGKALIALTPDERTEPEGLRAQVVAKLTEQLGVTVWDPGENYVDGEDYAAMLLTARDAVDVRRRARHRDEPVRYGLIAVGSHGGPERFGMAPFHHLDVPFQPATVATFGGSDALRVFGNAPARTYLVKDPLTLTDPAEVTEMFAAGAARAAMQSSVVARLRDELAHLDPMDPTPGVRDRWETLRALLAGANQSGQPAIPVGNFLQTPGGSIGGGLLEIGAARPDVGYVDLTPMDRSRTTETILGLRGGSVEAASFAVRESLPDAAIMQPVGTVYSRPLASALARCWAPDQTAIALNTIDGSAGDLGVETARELAERGYQVHLRLPANATPRQLAEAEQLGHAGVRRWHGSQPVLGPRAGRGVTRSPEFPRARWPYDALKPDRRGGMLMR